MRLKLLESRHVRVITAWALMASVTAHTSAVLATWVRQHAAGYQTPPPEGPISVRYLMPPDHIEHAVGERIQWVAPGVGTSGFVRGTGPARVVGHVGEDAPPPQATRVAPIPEGDLPDETRIYTTEDVDTAAARDPASDGPRYPAELREKGVQGEVLIEFTVDTAGHADTTTFTVVQTTHPLFTTAVREALPLMRFTPAVAHGHHVRQLVRLPMMFRLMNLDKVAT